MTNNEGLKFLVGPAYGRPRFIQVLWSQHHWSQFNWHQQPCSGGSQIKTYKFIFGIWWFLFTILQRSTENIGLFILFGSSYCIWHQCVVTQTMSGTYEIRKTNNKVTSYLILDTGCLVCLYFVTRRSWRSFTTVYGCWARLLTGHWPAEKSWTLVRTWGAEGPHGRTGETFTTL